MRPRDQIDSVEVGGRGRAKWRKQATRIEVCREREREREREQREKKEEEEEEAPEEKKAREVFFGGEGGCWHRREARQARKPFQNLHFSVLETPMFVRPFFLLNVSSNDRFFDDDGRQKKSPTPPPPPAASSQ